MLTTNKRFQLVRVEKETIDHCQKCGAHIKWSYWIRDNEVGEEFAVGSECAYYYQISDSNIKKAKKEATRMQKALAAVNEFIPLYEADPYNVDDYSAYNSNGAKTVLSKANVHGNTVCLRGEDILFVYNSQAICKYNIANKTRQYDNL